jgi:hypothetical protein
MQTNVIIKGDLHRMSKKIIIGSIAGLAAVSALALAPLSVDAIANQIHGGSYGANGSGNGIVIKAQAMDMTSDQLKEKLQTKTMADVIADQGMTTEQYQEKVQTAAQERWQEMGLSDEEIQTRTQAQTERQSDCDGTGSGLGQGQGYRHGSINQ